VEKVIGSFQLEQWSIRNQLNEIEIYIAQKHRIISPGKIMKYNFYKENFSPSIAYIR